MLLDPCLASEVPEASSQRGLNGSTASLGVLMGHCFRRSSGRGWRLRQRSMALWPNWVSQLDHPSSPLSLQTPLVQLAASAEEAERMRQLAQVRRERGLQFLEEPALPSAQTPWPRTGHGALLSEQDGRVDPLGLLRALRRAFKAQGGTLRSTSAQHLERSSAGGNGRWRVVTAAGDSLRVDAVVICSALGSAPLLEPLGHPRPMEAVLGQVLELKRQDSQASWEHWPAVLTCGGINLIPHGERQLWLGATVEPGSEANPSLLPAMQTLNNLAPQWLHDTERVGQWHGLRARPQGRPAPLLEQLEPGLILASGHYRNGVLLAPASAEWVSQQIDGSILTAP
ncbi:Glycine/D-amino acid oxidases (deaminating) [Synechococcus sp. WH 7803]|nr:Glycine/D-amino acid oxidases (deaminating) [Synechococcus sp. WH 7803]